MKVDFELVESSGFFDKTWYKEQYLNPNTKIDPIQHFLSEGYKNGNDPSERFSTKYYLETYKDVAKSNINPLLHFLKFGQKEGRMPNRHIVEKYLTMEKVDIVIPVYNALEDVKKCLQSVHEKTKDFSINVYLINDFSDKDTSEFLTEFCENKDSFNLINNLENLGYTKSVNIGLRLSKASYVITLNSDTIVTNGWLKGLLRCISSEPNIGIAGPLSNAASWQNIPILIKEGKFHINDVPNDMTVDEMANLVAACSSRDYPKLPFINGFCFMIKKEVIRQIGYLDEISFPLGYGEENDFCIRAQDKGFKLAIADDVYVYHAKSKSFGHTKKNALSKLGHEAIQLKHTKKKFDKLLEKVKDTYELDKIRNELRRKECKPSDLVLDNINVLFVLPVKGGSGGANSVIQEANQMRNIGLNAQIAVKKKDLQHIKNLYSDLLSLNDLFIGFEDNDLHEKAINYDILVATIFTTVGIVKDITDKNPHILAAYYIQDYEPFFFVEKTNMWHEARNSYSLLPNGILFAKTNWIINKVREQHEIEVNKVQPSIDSTLYFPNFKSGFNQIIIAAMLRPKTPRRGAERTVDLLREIASKYQNRVSIKLFGCNTDDEEFEKLNIDFEFENLGFANRPTIAKLMRESDIFIDLSDYQAFGRTGLESMASGCAALVTKFGGTDEYIIDGFNSVLVDPFNPDECLEKLGGLIQNRVKLEEIKFNAIKTASNYSTIKAALSEAELFKNKLLCFREKHPKPQKTKFYYLPLIEPKTGKIENKNCYERTVFPFRSDEFKITFETIEISHFSYLEEIESNSILFIYLDPSIWQNEDFINLIKRCKKNGVKLVADITEIKEADIKSIGNSNVLEYFKLFEKVVSNQSFNNQIIEGIKVYKTPTEMPKNLWRIGLPKFTGKGIFEKKDGDPYRIGFIGVDEDYSKVEQLKNSIISVEAITGRNVTFETIGVGQKNPLPFGTRIGLPKNRAYDSYITWLHKRVNWDAGVIYLKENCEKSEIEDAFQKYLEYTALGLITIASNSLQQKAELVNLKNVIFTENIWSSWADCLLNASIDTNLNETVLTNAKILLNEEIKNQKAISSLKKLFENID